ncbi:MAG: helix-turn-helix domain-containing protein, partial [Veillonella sp.]|nr:helix-turn-helix domain-containing protein [Veillonella sp.]
MKLTERQQKIADMVQHEGPITGKTIAARLDVTRSALRSDLAVLTMMGLLDA